MMTTAISSIGILLILAIKKVLQRHISARWQYNLGLLFFALLAVPFIPSSFFASLNMGQWFNRFRFEEVANTTTAATQGTAHATGLLQDFAVPANSSQTELLVTIFVGIWVAGIIVSIIILLLCYRKLRLIKQSVKPIENREVLALFLRCKADVGVKNNILLGSSILVKAPMTVGLFKTQIILPAKKISHSDTRYAMLHELAHCKNMDTKINGLMCLFQILYWFNPAVYFTFKQMRLDRELACDAAVLKILPKKYHISYGKTLLNFMKPLTAGLPILAANMGDSKPHIIKRVEHIAAYTAESPLLKVKSICLFFLVVLLILCKIPVISAFAGIDDSRFNFQANNVQHVDLSSFLGSFQGSFVLYNTGANLYTIHNMDMGVTRVSPFSTYKIASALIALEMGVLDANNTVREWDGATQPFDTWSADHNLATAMGSSVSWYFQDLDSLVGTRYLQHYLNLLQYGNRNISGGTLDFWNGSSLRISPLEQVIFLRSLLKNDLEFEHMAILRNAIVLSEYNGAVLSGKTGSGISTNGGVTSGWFVGYVERGGNAYIFATYIQGNDYAWGSAAAEITLSILNYKGIY